MQNHRFNLRLNPILVLCSFIATMVVNSAMAKTSDSTQYHAKKTSNLPEIIRDGLHPYQYYGLTRLYLRNFYLEKAKICLEKLRNSKPRDLSEKLYMNLRKEQLPKGKISPELAERCRKTAAMAHENEQRYQICRELIEENSEFEWPYMILADEGYTLGESSLKSQNELMHKVLSFNPTYKPALSKLKDVIHNQKYLEDRKAAAIKADSFKNETAQQSSIQMDEEHKKHIAQFMVKKKYFLIDKNGELPFETGPGVSIDQRFSDGLLKVSVRSEMGSSEIQFWDKNGDLKFSVRAMTTERVSEGLVAVYSFWPGIRGSRYGFYDTDGKVAIPGRFSKTEEFKEGLAAAEIRQAYVDRASTWGFISHDGNWQIEPIYDDVFSFSEGLAPVSIGGKIGFINKSGNFSIPPIYDHARPFSEGLANVVIFDHKNHALIDKYIDHQGKVVFERAQVIPGGKPLAELRSKGILSAYSTTPRHEHAPRTDERSPWDFHDGLVVDMVNNKFGYRDKTGKNVIDAVYGWTYPFSDGRGKVWKDKAFGFVNKQGNLVIEAKFAKAKDFSNGLAAVSPDGKHWGYIDQNGTMVIKPQYLEAEPFAEGIARVAVAENTPEK